MSVAWMCDGGQVSKVCVASQLPTGMHLVAAAGERARTFQTAMLVEMIGLNLLILCECRPLWTCGVLCHVRCRYTVDGCALDLLWLVI